MGRPLLFQLLWSISNFVRDMKNKLWVLILIGLAITFLGVVTKKFFFLLLILPLTLFYKKEE